jgi:hypothetical protein
LLLNSIGKPTPLSRTGDAGIADTVALEMDGRFDARQRERTARLNSKIRSFLGCER